jgi:hypothetical protein
MTSRVEETSPQTYARIVGLLYLFIIVAALFGEAYARGSLIVHGDATATAHNLLASETLFRAGTAAELLTCVCDVTVAILLYLLLQPVSRSWSLVAAAQRLVFVAVYACAKLFLLATVLLLDGSDFLKTFRPDQLHSLAYLTLRLHDAGYGLSLIFFGVHCLLLGYLIYRAGYLPRTLGVLLVIAGVGYLINSFVDILAPTFGRNLFPWILLPAFFAELGLCLWLLVKGVDLPKWEERARA